MPSESDPAGAAQGKEESFEVLLERLESIVSQLEAGERPLDESLALYENGVSTLKRCHTILDRADKRIRTLLQDGTLRDAELPNRGERAEKSGVRRGAPPTRAASQPHEEPEEEDSENAREVQKKVANSTDEPVDSEAESQHNSPTSVKSKTKPDQSGNQAGGLLFGSAQ